MSIRYHWRQIKDFEDHGYSYYCNLTQCMTFRLRPTKFCRRHVSEYYVRELRPIWAWLSKKFNRTTEPKEVHDFWKSPPPIGSWRETSK